MKNIVFAGAGPEVDAGLVAGATCKSGKGRSGTAQDLAKGRRTEIDFMNCYVAAQGELAGIPAPTQALATSLVKRMERGEPALVEAL